MISVCDVKRTIGGLQSGTFLNHFIPPEFYRLKRSEVERLGQPHSFFPQNIRRSMSQNERVIQYPRTQAPNAPAPFHRLEAISYLGSEASLFEDIYFDLRSLLFSIVVKHRSSNCDFVHDDARWRKRALRVSGSQMMAGWLIVSSAAPEGIFYMGFKG